MGHLDLTSMFLLGLFGTGHCLGMCGPLVLAVPAATGRFSSHVLYNLGRMMTYTAVGAIMGGIAGGMAVMAQAGGADPLDWTVRVQVGFSLIAAVFLLALGMARLGFLPEPGWMATASPSKIPGFKNVLIAGREGSLAGMFLFGLFMGFLPCGLSFAAFARALASGGPLEGGILAAAFAVGTLPGLLLLGTGFSRVAVKYRRYSDPVSGTIMVGMAASLLAAAWQAMG